MASWGWNADVSFSARFTDAEEAKACFTYSNLLVALPGAKREGYEQAATVLAEGPPAPTEYAELLRARLGLQIGTYFEKAGETVRAIALYEQVTSPECQRTPGAAPLHDRAGRRRTRPFGAHDRRSRERPGARLRA